MVRVGCPSIRIHQRGALLRHAKLTGLVGAEIGLCGAWVGSAWLAAASLTLVGVATALLSRALGSRTLVAAGEVSVDEHGLQARGGDRVVDVPLTRVASAYRLWRRPRPEALEDTSDEVSIVTHEGRHLQLRLTSEDEASRLLEALGFGPNGRTVRFPVGGVASSAPLGYGLALLLMGFFGSLAAVAWMVGVLAPSGHALLLAVLSSATTLLAWGAARARQVEVGTDGVAVHGPGGTRFYGYHDVAIERAGRGDLGLRILADGRRVPLSAAPGEDRAFASLRAHLEAAWRRAREVRSEPILHDRRKVATAFRIRELEADDLADILADPRLPADERLEAGRLLAARDPARGAEALRAVADQSCDLELRDGLVRLAR